LYLKGFLCSHVHFHPPLSKFFTYTGAYIELN